MTKEYMHNDPQNKIRVERVIILAETPHGELFNEAWARVAHQAVPQAQDRPAPASARRVRDDLAPGEFGMPRWAGGLLMIVALWLVMIFLEAFNKGV